MKKLTLMLAATLLLAATTAMADPNPPVYFTFEGHTYQAKAEVVLGWAGGWDGGRFSANTVNPTGNGDLGVTVPFDTFCVEDQIYFYPNTTYWASIDIAAVAGVPNHVYGSSSLLTARAAWIYDQFRQTNHGLLAGVVGLSDQMISTAIWHEMGLAWGTNAVTVLADANAPSDPTQIGTVKVMNLWTLSDFYTVTLADGHQQQWAASVVDAQSQLIDLGGAIVPAPAAIVLGLIGLGLVGGVMRRVVR